MWLHNFLPENGKISKLLKEPAAGLDRLESGTYYWLRTEFLKEVQSSKAHKAEIYLATNLLRKSASIMLSNPFHWVVNMCELYMYFFFWEIGWGLSRRLRVPPTQRFGGFFHCLCNLEVFLGPLWKLVDTVREQSTVVKTTLAAARLFGMLSAFTCTLYNRCCYITMDTETVASQNRFCS